MRRCARSTLLLLLVGAGAAHAQSAGASDRSFDLDHVQLAITSGDFLGLEGSPVERPWGFRVGAAFGWVRDPLIGRIGDGPPQVLVSERAMLHALGGVRLG